MRFCSLLGRGLLYSPGQRAPTFRRPGPKNGVSDVWRGLPTADVPSCCELLEVHHLPDSMDSSHLFLYPLVNVYIKLYGNDHHAINGTTHYFDWAIFNSYVQLPEGKSHKNPIKIPFSIDILVYHQ